MRNDGRDSGIEEGSTHSSICEFLPYLIYKKSGISASKWMLCQWISEAFNFCILGAMFRSPVDMTETVRDLSSHVSYSLTFINDSEVSHAMWRKMQFTDALNISIYFLPVRYDQELKNDNIFYHNAYSLIYHVFCRVLPGSNDYFILLSGGKGV